MTEPSTAVLFVHGIQGSPLVFQFLIDALPNEVEIHNLLLPGHGGSARDFRASGQAAWLSAVRGEAKRLLNQGKRVVYVGHSMGCLLGLAVSRDLGDPFAGMLLLCCPFRIRPTGRYITNGLRVLRKARPDEPPQVKAAREANSVRLRHPAEHLTLIHPYLELLRLMGKIRRAGPRGPKGIRFYFSEADEIVSPGSRTEAARFPEAAVRVLPGCGHNNFTEPAKQSLRLALQHMTAEERI